MQQSLPRFSGIVGEGCAFTVKYLTCNSMLAIVTTPATGD